jgi:hypothetical protein
VLCLGKQREVSRMQAFMARMDDVGAAVCCGEEDAARAVVGWRDPTSIFQTVH